MYRILIVIGSILMVIGLCFPSNSTGQFVCFQLVAVLMSLSVIYTLTTSRKTYISLLLPLITNANSAAMLSLYTFMAPNDIVYNGTYLIKYLESSYLISFTFFIPPIVVYAISKFIKPRSSEHGLLSSNLQMTDRHYWITLVVFSFLFISFFSDLLFEIPILGYLSRVAREAFLLFTFWLGFWNFRLKGLFYFAVGVVLVTAVFSILKGGRFYAFIQLGALLIGYITSQPPKRRKFLIKLTVACFPVVFALSGVLSFVRGQIGRGVETVNVDRFDSFVETFSRIVSDGEFIQENRSLSLEGIRRNIKWPNLAVITLSPDPIPYRGLENIELEFVSILNIAGVSSGFDVESVRNAREKNIEAGLNTGMANRYGYNVNRLNSVEWGLMADAWSRGGPLIYILYFFIVIGLFAYLERKIIEAKLHPAEKALLIVVLIRILWFNTGSDPLYYIIRKLILSFSLSFFVILGVRFLTVRRYQKVKYPG